MSGKSSLFSGVRLSLSPAPRLESPLPVSSRGSRAAKLARSVLRTPLSFPCQPLGAAATLPPEPGQVTDSPCPHPEHGQAQGPTGHPLL